MSKPLIGLAVAVALLGGACANDSGGDGVASLSGGQADAAPATPSKDPQDAALEWAACMRENGIDMPDPKIDDNGFIMIEPGDGPMPDEEDYLEADEACRDLLGEPQMPDLSPEERARLQDAGLRFAECMREQGVDVPDPGPNGDMAIPIGGPDGVDPRDPEFQAAEEKCRPIMEEVMGEGPMGEGVDEVGGNS